METTPHLAVEDGRRPKATGGERKGLGVRVRVRRLVLVPVPATGADRCSATHRRAWSGAMPSTAPGIEARRPPLLLPACVLMTPLPLHDELGLIRARLYCVNEVKAQKTASLLRAPWGKGMKGRMCRMDLRWRVYEARPAAKQPRQKRMSKARKGGGGVGAQRCWARKGCVPLLLSLARDVCVFLVFLYHPLAWCAARAHC